MTRFITVDELPQYAPGELRLDSTPVGRPDFRMRVFSYGPSDIYVPPTDNFLVVIYRHGVTAMNRRVTGAWKREHVGHGITTLLTRAEPSHWRWDNDIEVSHFYISPVFMLKTASEAFDNDTRAVELHDLLGIDDPVLNWINDQMVHEVAAGGPGAAQGVLNGIEPHYLRLGRALGLDPGFAGTEILVESPFGSAEDLRDIGSPVSVAVDVERVHFLDA